MNIRLTDPESWLISPPNVHEVFDPAALDVQIGELAHRVGDDPEHRDAFAREVGMAHDRITSIFLAAGTHDDYLGLDIIDRIAVPDVRRSCAEAVVVSRSPLVPLDLRVGALARLDELGVDRTELIGSWARSAPEFQPIPVVDPLYRDTDGVDHVFDVPTDSPAFVALLLGAAERFQDARVRRLLERPPGAPDSQRDENKITATVRSHISRPLLVPDDYLVMWDEAIAMDVAGQPLTIAELAKAILLHSVTRLPGRAIRRATVAFYRSVLGIAGRAIVGIGSGFLYVEHGSEAEPSYVYVGQGAIIGKGVTLDTVGGVVLGRESFIGGGFLPLLIHTHKHLRPVDGPAALERKRISRTAFVADQGARFPLGVVGMFECADHLGRPEAYAGIRVVEVDGAAEEEGDR